MLEFIELGAATDVPVTNKDLRHCLSTVCTGEHLVAHGGVHGDVNFLKLHVLGREQSFGAVAISAQHSSIDRYFGHLEISSRVYLFSLYITFCEPLAIGNTVTGDSSGL